MMTFFDKIADRMRLRQMSLRFKLALYFVAPISAAFLLLSWSHYLRERRLYEDQVQLTAVLISDIAFGSLQHSFQTNNTEMTSNVLRDLEKRNSIQKAFIVNMSGIVQESSDTSERGKEYRTTEIGCLECHELPSETRPRVTHLRSVGGPIRISRPIENDPECQECHSPDQKHLGILLIDTTLTDIESHLLTDLGVDLTISILVTILILSLAYYLIQWMILRRIELIDRTLAAYARGNFSSRVPRIGRSEDEITQFAQTFNRMADTLESQEKKQIELNHARRSAIIEERERIARELHDGVAQMLGYITTKITAAKIYISKSQLDDAGEQLSQIDRVVQDQSIDVRASILGLKLATQNGKGLAKNIRVFVEQTNRLSDLQIQLNIDEEVEGIRIDPEVELQMVRIIQEAVSNIRKHARATYGEIRLRIEARMLHLSICDDGEGFKPWDLHLKNVPHFGIQIMQERAIAIGASFNIDSDPGLGTCVNISMKLEEE